MQGKKNKYNQRKIKWTAGKKKKYLIKNNNIVLQKKDSFEQRDCAWWAEKYKTTLLETHVLWDNHHFSMIKTL